MNDAVSYIGYVTFTGPNDPQAISDILSNNGKEISNKTNSYFSLALFNILREMNPLGVDVQYYQPGYGPNATVHFKVYNFVVVFIEKFCKVKTKFINSEIPS